VGGTTLPLKRIGSLREIAQVAAWLRSAASSVNGITSRSMAASSPEQPEMNAEDRMFAAHKRRDL
jgi:hypothetical protein